jgi:hypothetical protein
MRLELSTHSPNLMGELARERRSPSLSITALELAREPALPGCLIGLATPVVE